MMAANLPLDSFIPNHHPHSRSNSISSSSHSACSRPQSSQGLPFMRNPVVMPPTAEDLYRASLPPYASAAAHGNHARHLSDASHSSGWSTDLLTPGDSPPNHNLANPALKSHFRQTHIRARVAASPYPRDTESVHSSSSETEDIAMYLGPTATDYNTMYASPQMLGGSPDMNTAGAFGRMHLGPDHALEKLAANVRAATTTSASDRAKQIFVQAWYARNLMHRCARFCSQAPVIFLTQAHRQLRSLPRRQRAPPGPVLFVPPCLRPVWYPAHKHRHAGQGHQALFPYNQNQAPWGQGEQ